MIRRRDSEERARAPPTRLRRRPRPPRAPPPLLPSPRLSGPARPGVPGRAVEAAGGRRPQRLRLVPRLRAARRAGAARGLGPARPRERLPRRCRPRRQAGARARPGHGVPDLLHGAHGGRGGGVRGGVRRVHRRDARPGPRGPRRAAAGHAGHHRPQPRRLVVPAPHARVVGQVRPGEHLRHASGPGHVRHHPGRGHPFAPARALGRPLAGGAADERDHDRDRAAAGRPGTRPSPTSCASPPRRSTT